MLEVAPDLFTQRGDRIRLLGIPFDTQGVVIRMPNGGLWLHSPVRPTKAGIDEISNLGPIAHIIAPNRIHGAFTSDWAAIAPEATVWVSPKFSVRHPDIDFDHTLDDTAPEAWADILDQCHFRGSIYLDEMVFLHRPSGTLIVTDILQSHDPNREPWMWRQVKRLAGILAPDVATPPDLKRTFRDRERARAARDRILSWEFDRILMPHAVPVMQDGKATFARAMAWLD